MPGLLIRSESRVLPCFGSPANLAGRGEADFGHVDRIENDERTECDAGVGANRSDEAWVLGDEERSDFRDVGLGISTDD